MKTPFLAILTAADTDMVWCGMYEPVLRCQLMSAHVRTKDTPPPADTPLLCKKVEMCQEGFGTLEKQSIIFQDLI